MKVAGMVAAGVILAGQLAWAQEGRRPTTGEPGRPGFNRGEGWGRGDGPGRGFGWLPSAGRLRQELNLTDEQINQLRPILIGVRALIDQLRTEIDELRDLGDGQEEVRRAKLDELRRKMLAAIAPAKTFLTPEQYQMLEARLVSRAPVGTGTTGQTQSAP